MTVTSYPTREYPTLLHAAADLCDYPTDARGYARSACETVATIDWHIMSRDDLREVLEMIAQRTRAHVEKLQLDPRITAEVRLGGQGTAVGIDGTVQIWLTAAGHPVALA